MRWRVGEKMERLLREAGIREKVVGPTGDGRIVINTCLSERKETVSIIPGNIL